MLDDAARVPELDPTNMIIHFDRGVHYRTLQWQARQQQLGFHASMWRKGNSGDNARCEGFFGRMKMEMFYGQTWKEPDDLIAEINDYIDFHNNDKISADSGLTIPEGRAIHPQAS